MTESEAIELIEKDLKLHSKDLSSKYKNGLRMAIQALEKQIPKKPKTDDRYVMHICQCCNDFVKVSHNYCQNCGQKLDWGDEEYGKNES